MIFTLNNVVKVEENGTVAGAFLQDHIGTLETAIERAIGIESANSNAIDVAVVSNRMDCMPFAWYSNLTRLDKKKREHGKIKQGI